MKLALVLLATALLVSAAQAAPSSRLDGVRNVAKSVREFFHEMREVLHEKHEEASVTLSEKWQNLKEKLAERKEKRVAFAKKVLENVNTYNKETLEKVMKVLQPYREELGKLYQQLEAKVNARFGREPHSRETRSLRDGKTLREFFDEMKEHLSEKGKEVSATLSQKFQALKEKLAEGKEKREAFVHKVLDKFQTYSQDALEKVMKVLQPYKEELGKLYHQLEAKMQERFGKNKPE